VKIAVLLSSIAERTYPQLWPTMVDDFIQTWIHSTLPRQEVVVMCLEYVLTDSIDIDYGSVLSSQRKQDIIAGITSSQESLFNTSFHFLQHLTSEMNTYTDENMLRAYVDPVSSLLGLLRVLAAVVKIDDFCSPSHNFALQLVGLLSMGIPSLQMKLLEVLQVMVQSTMGEDLFVEVLSAFAHCSIGTAGLELEDELQLQCQLASVLHCLLSHHVSYVNSDDSVQRIDKYLS